MSMFLKQFMGLDVNIQELEEQKNTFLTEEFKKRESDIIYKVKNSGIYFLIEHQSTVDATMAQRILKYSLLIIENAQKNKNKRRKEVPLVIPIVLYTGRRKWTSATNFSKLQISKKKYKEYKIKLKYKLVDVNRYTEEELIDKNTKLAYMMLIEKCYKTTDLVKVIIRLILLTNDDERIFWLKRIVKFVLSKQLGQEKEEILEILEKKEKNEMEELKERIEKYERNLMIKERRKGKKEGEKEVIMSVIRNMIRLNQDETTIMKFTNAKKEDIQKVKKQLGIQVN